MPKDGAYIVSDLPKDRLFEIVCAPCERVGRFKRETLIERFGPDQNIPDLIAKLSACPKHGQYHDACKVRLAEPVQLSVFQQK